MKGDNAAFIAGGVPVSDIRWMFGATDMLVDNGSKGVALAEVMGDKDIVLMRAQEAVACAHGIFGAARSAIRCSGEKRAGRRVCKDRTSR